MLKPPMAALRSINEYLLQAGVGLIEKTLNTVAGAAQVSHLLPI